MSISIKLAKKLHKIAEAAPNAHAFNITFKLTQTNMVQVVISPTAEANFAEKASPGFARQIITLSKSVKPNRYYNFTQYLVASGLRDYLASLEDAKKIKVTMIKEDETAAEDVFGHPTLGTSEDPIYDHAILGKISITVL